MKLLYHDPPYYHALWDKIFEMPIGEVELKHKNDDEKIKFENHIKHFIDADFYADWNWYLEFSNDYTKLVKKEYPYNRKEYLEKPENKIN